MWEHRRTRDDLTMKGERERERERKEKGTRQIRMFIWSRKFQWGVTMNILMTSCGCSRLWASCKVGIREESGTSLYGGRAKRERSREEQTAAEGKSSVSPFLGNYNRATYRATASSPLLSLSLSRSISLSPYHPPLGRPVPLPSRNVDFILR